MFLGIQDGLIAVVAQTRAEIENMPCMIFTEIIETNQPVEMVNCKYYVGTNNIQDAKMGLTE
ncbi:MAG: hypothetical protein E7006_01430 [Alphaproteobacteria bacterium]|nr:hypothetical protein [Alphaproteobacteria bacterium]